MIILDTANKKAEKEAKIIYIFSVLFFVFMNSTSTSSHGTFKFIVSNFFYYSFNFFVLLQMLLQTTHHPHIEEEKKTIHALWKSRQTKNIENLLFKFTLKTNRNSREKSIYWINALTCIPATKASGSSHKY